MRVLLWIDALEPQLGGIGRYTWELCRGLAAREDVQARYFGRGRRIEDPGRLVRGDPLPSSPPLAIRRLHSWWEQRSLKADLVHGPNYFLPPFADTGVVTVHDLSVFRHPETHPADRISAFERHFTDSLNRAAHVITDTETVRRELMNDYGVAADRVSAVWLGVDQRFRPAANAELKPALAQLGLEPRGYGLCVSTLEPRKKIAELLSAWRLLPAKTRDRYPLVLAGAKGWRNDDLIALIRDGTAEGWLRHLGFVDEALLPDLYAGAALFIYPSVYEGFGLPPLEAMASGAPVMVANRSCLPEVCGDAACYVEPDDPQGFRDTISQLLDDDERRADLVSRGLERARSFSWNRCIEGTVAAYRQAKAVI